MLTSGDVVDVYLGVPTGSEAGMTRPAVVITAQRTLAREPSVIQVVPLTTKLRGYASEVVLHAGDGNGLDHDSAAQCQHIRAVAAARAGTVRGNVGPMALSQICDVLVVLLDLP